MRLPARLAQILSDLNAAGLRALVAGGAVRDWLLGLTPKDFDVEVYGIGYEKLAELLSGYGRVDLVGKSFGVVKLIEAKLFEADFSIPRLDSKTGSGHRDFESSFDPNITPRDAAARRDFTINSMSYDPASGEIVDFFGGRRDLENRILRATSDAFPEDPLRVLRGLQFACRFDLTLERGTAALCRSIADQYSTIARERIAEEFMKWALKSVRPGKIGEYLAASGWIVHFPEIEALSGVPQEPEWHPEGDVGTHTGLVLDAAARVAVREGLEGDERAVLIFSALCHDLAKATTTMQRERDGRMRWTSWGHEEAGGPMARAFLERIGIKAAIVDPVVRLVELHLSHMSVGTDPTPRAVRRLALRLAPATIVQLTRLVEADTSGRPPLPAGLPENARKILEVAEAQSVEQGPQAPLILGRHVLPYFGGKPGKHIGDVTKAAYEAQADGAFSTEEEALAWLDRYMKN